MENVAWHGWDRFWRMRAAARRDKTGEPVSLGERAMCVKGGGRPR